MRSLDHAFESVYIISMKASRWSSPILFLLEKINPSAVLRPCRELQRCVLSLTYESKGSVP
jgi:hypothetical protein